MTRSQTLHGLLRETSRLQRKLQRLVDTYPEENLEPDEKILNRILTNDWRHAHGGVHGPHERRYWEAVAWVNRFDAYASALHDHCLYDLEDKNRLTALPLVRRLRIPAAECIHLLKIQERMIAGWSDKAERARPTRSDRKGLQKLRSCLRALVDAKGMKTVAAETGCNRDTVADFLKGTTMPQERTVKLLRKYVTG